MSKKGFDEAAAPVSASQIAHIGVWIKDAGADNSESGFGRHAGATIQVTFSDGNVHPLKLSDLVHIRIRAAQEESVTLPNGQIRSGFSREDIILIDAARTSHPDNTGGRSIGLASEHQRQQQYQMQQGGSPAQQHQMGDNSAPKPSEW